MARASTVRRLPPVLIQGETGSGKGLVARSLHKAGPRSDGPFVDINCAAIPETLLEAEMFGFERGAFTDARQAKRGLFQTAHRGTLFLDEIGLLPEGLQAKLLTVLEERTVRRLGATQSEPVDVWVIAATNLDLQAATQAGRFREDLYHRLAVLTLTLPPLRERQGDILLLAEHFLARACADYGLAPKTLAPDARAALVAYRWPGNIRELINTMERVALLTEAPVVTADVLGLSDRAPAPRRPRRPAEAPAARPRWPPWWTPPSGPMSRRRSRRPAGTSRAPRRVSASRATRSATASRSTGSAPARPRRPAALGRRPRPRRRRPRRAPRGRPGRRRRRRRERARRRVAALRSPSGGSGGASRSCWRGSASDRDAGPLDTGRVIETLVDKVRSFGGRVEELGATGFVALFGLDPVEHPVRRAALAAARHAAGGPAVAGRRPEGRPPDRHRPGVVPPGPPPGRLARRHGRQAHGARAR